MIVKTQTFTVAIAPNTLDTAFALELLLKPSEFANAQGAYIKVTNVEFMSSYKP